MVGKSGIPAVIALGALAANASAAVILNDSFTDNDRTNQDVPDSAAVYLGRAGTTTVAGNLAVTPSAAASNFIGFGYFTPSGSPVQLAVGDKITYSFDFSVATNTATNGSGLRFALLNSQGTRASGDVADIGSATTTSFSDERGYGANFSVRNAGSNAGFINAQERAGTSDTLFTGTNGFAAIGANSTTAQGTAANTPQTALVSVEYTDASTMTITATVGAATVTRTDTSGLVTAFDMFAFFSDGANSTVTIDNVNVSTTPEPACLGIIASLGGLMLRRRRRADLRPM